MLAAVVVAAVTALLLVLARRRRAWRSDLEDAEHEVAWFGRDLVPRLRASGSFAGVSGGWAVASPRLQTLDDRLTRLVSTAPDDAGRGRATAVQDAVRTARDRMVALIAAGETSSWSLALDEVQAPLLDVLVPSPPQEPGPAGAAG